VLETLPAVSSFQIEQQHLVAKRHDLGCAELRGVRCASLATRSILHRLLRE
jgi:hypothetical protein